MYLLSFWLVARFGCLERWVFCSLYLLSVLTTLKLAEHFLMLGELGRRRKTVRNAGGCRFLKGYAVLRWIARVQFF